MGRRAEQRRAPRQRRVPSGRVERLARIGWLAGELAVGSVATALGRRVGTRSGDDGILSPDRAQRVARELSRLRGAAMKIGQLLSIEASDLLPSELSEAFEVLRADAHPMPETQLRRVLARAWGAAWEERLASFDWEPMAAASIGQVHAGRDRTGRPLAIKVQYPGVARSIESDIDNFAALVRLARLLPGRIDLEPAVAEAKRQLRLETDYRREARNLARYRSLLRGEEAYAVPQVQEELSTRRVLAMERLEGLPLEDLCGPDHSQSARDAAAAKLYRLLFLELFAFGYCQTDPNFANYLYEPGSGRIGLLDLGSARSIPSRLRRNYRRLLRAGIARDRRAIRETCEEVGFFDPSERRDRIESVVDLVEASCEPFRVDRYDFGASDLAARMRAKGLELALEQGFTHSPPAETMFLHRKIGGTFLLCARLRARVRARGLIEPFLAARS